MSLDLRRIHVTFLQDRLSTLGNNSDQVTLPQP